MKKDDGLMKKLDNGVTRCEGRLIGGKTDWDGKGHYASTLVEEAYSGGDLIG